MKLSVIIVNYNVEYFLEQCLYSVRKACLGLDSEVWVVDNDSIDGSLKMVQSKFPEVNVIANKTNTGFSKANNQAIQQARGEYVLLLNPDTIVEEDTFLKVVNFMDSHQDAGGLGVKMVDGKGKFLPESKRGLPTPSVAFYKIFGLSTLFPGSKTFGKYHLTYLNNEETHCVDVLSGAFMLLRKTALDKTGLLDEDYFMYGEDVDLSYRITKAGYKNYYFPGTRIVHYKGESTKKSSVNYVFTFYNAMAIFAGKHFSKSNARLFITLINLAIYFRASLSLGRRFALKAFIPVLDAFTIYGGVLLLKNYWESVIFQGGGHYPPGFIFIALPLYTAVWILAIFLSGGYDRPFKLLKVFQGVFVGTVVILTAYGLLNESMRYSRALILFGAIWGAFGLTAIRFALHLSGLKAYRIGFEENRRYAIIGHHDECERVAEILRRTHQQPGFIGFVGTETSELGNYEYIGKLSQIRDIIRIYGIHEVIFCGRDVSSQEIIDQMADLQELEVDYKTAPPESMSIIGSNSISTTGDLFIVDINSIAKPRNLRNKRFFDISLALVLLLSYPALLFVVKQKAGLFANIIKVLFGKKSWIGFSKHLDKKHRLPKVKMGVLTPDDAWPLETFEEKTSLKLNLLYARDYRVMNDLTIIYRAFGKLGQG
jgi:GT2 family glycosyltransferase